MRIRYLSGSFLFNSCTYICVYLLFLLYALDITSESLFLHCCAVWSNRCWAVVCTPALRPGLQPPVGALPAGSSLPAALPQHSKETHAHTHTQVFQYVYFLTVYETSVRNATSSFSWTWRATRCTSRRPTATAPSDISPQRLQTLEWVIIIAINLL